MKVANSDVTSFKSDIKLSKSQKQRFRRKKEKVIKRAAKLAFSKPEPKETRTTSSITFPEKKQFESSFDSDEKRLELARSRLGETHMNTLQIRPIPRKCPPGLIKDLCPLAINVRFPSKRSARYVFVQFRNNGDLLSTQESLVSALLNGKSVKAARCLATKRDSSLTGTWCEPNLRTVSDFTWKKVRVLNLPRSTTRMDLAQVFPKATSINMPTYDDGSCKGSCTLVFNSKSYATKVVATRHGTFIRNNPIYVNFALKTRSKPTSVSADSV